MAKWEDHKDRPREEIMDMADKAIERFKARGWPGTKVYFKFTCESCGERVTFQEPNKLWESGECCFCGHSTKIEKAGFSLVAGMEK